MNAKLRNLSQEILYLLDRNSRIEAYFSQLKHNTKTIQ